jgi:hypothetical protein
VRSLPSWAPRLVERWPPVTPSVDVAAVLADRLGLPAGSCVPVWSARAQARSTVHFLGTADRPGLCRWVVKQPRTNWTQDDVASPLAAAREFAGLLRLAGHFTARGGPARVPAPVALLPELEGFVTAYVPGPAVSDLLHTRSVLSPAALLDGVGRAAVFLRGLHELEALPARTLDLAQEAGRVRVRLQQRLAPAGLPVPPAVAQTLAAVPSGTVTTRQVWLHGDCTPANVLLPEGRTVVGIDIDLQETGAPEEDLARFVAFTTGSVPFLVDAVLPERLRRHRPLVGRFLECYGPGVCAPVFELQLLQQLAGRWLRLRQLARLHGRPALLPLRLQTVDAQLQSLLLASARRLARATWT